MAAARPAAGTLLAVERYHQRTKHHFQRSARSPGHLDWQNQPDPFRRFAGAPRIGLPYPSQVGAWGYDELFAGDAIPARDLTTQSIASFLEHSLALAAWKAFQGSRWALRVNPSSGNLHPTEGYLILPAVEGLTEQAGVMHYAAEAHALEWRAGLPAATWTALGEAFPGVRMLVGLSTIAWREAWKYGERAYRYCQHDIGHALAALSFSAALHGWRLHLLEDCSDALLAGVLGLDRAGDFAGAEAEEPALIAAVMPPGAAADVPRGLPAPVLDAAHAAAWCGRANCLSGRHVDWPAIDDVARHCRKPPTRHAEAAVTTSADEPADAARAIRAGQVIRQRRSAVAMDGRTALADQQLFGLLRRTLPDEGRPPWAGWPHAPQVNLLLFVHRVTGLEAGLYWFQRQPERLETLRQHLAGEFAWAPCHGDIPLYRLVAGDCRTLAARLSCGQAIAGDGAFSLGMIAQFSEALQASGAWYYRRLFWETGMIGQLLYLEAEAAGLRGTGIGCFFDDPVHELLGLGGLEYQSLYHFTVGGAVDDARLTTLPPYDEHRIAD